MFEINSEKWAHVRIYVCLYVFVVCENVTRYFYLWTLGIYYRFSYNIYLVWTCGKTINLVIVISLFFSLPQSRPEYPYGGGGGGGDGPI